MNKRKKPYKKINPEMKSYFCVAYAKAYIKKCGKNKVSKEGLIGFLKRYNKEGLKFNEEIYLIVTDLVSS